MEWLHKRFEVKGVVHSKEIQKKKETKNMPIIEITQQNLDQQKPVDKGWHRLKIDKFMEKASKDAKSINYTFLFKVDDENDSNNNRYVSKMYNSKIIGTTIVPLIAAIKDVPIDAPGLLGNIDLAALEGSTIYAEVTERVYEGKIQKDIDTFASISAGPRTL